MIFIKFFILFLLSISLYSKEMYFDTISLSKVKKLIKKEEQIAKAYKSYILENGKRPTSISSLTLPAGFSDSNLFNGDLTLHSSKSYIKNTMPSSVKSALYDEYYSNKNRVYTKAPSSKINENIQVVLSTKEKYILNTTLPITTSTSNLKNKYHLDSKGVLHWYDSSGDILYSYDDKLVVYSKAGLIDEDGNISDTNLSSQNVLYPGQKILNVNTSDIAEEYVNIGGNYGIIKVGETSRDIGETIIQFTRRAGGMIVNGDIYTWGNNANEILGLGTNTYSGATGSSRYPVVTGLVRAKAKTYDNQIDSKNYFSSPLRPKFVDFFSTVYHSTCGVTVEGALYCGGSKGSSYSFGSSFTHVLDEDGNLVSSDDPEMLYRSRFFDGSTNKAAKIFANNQIWLILSQGGDIYRWGYDHSGFSGNGDRYFNYSYRDYNKDPEKLSVIESGTNVKFSDITYLLTINYRKMGALSQNGDIYIWGIENNIASGRCEVRWEGEYMNLCKPLKVDTSDSLGTDISFTSIKGGLEAFVGKSTDEKFYKIYQPKNKKPIVQSVEDIIKNYDEYKEGDDNEILSVDFSSKTPISESTWNTGIVWVNGKNELKGDYFTDDNKNDDFFKSAISKIKWKKIKVIEDDNGMCGIDIYNQMYCWGKMSFYRSGSGSSNIVGNTFMLPVFNTNLYDADKDFLVAEGGYSAYLTKMTSGEWNSSGNDFFIKYPTYIGGFNYEFTFK
ncbi:MAG: hypothetical protein ACPG9K_03235 [Poseidonibacter sp.]